MNRIVRDVVFLKATCLLIYLVLIIAGTHRLFYTSAVTARCNRVDSTTLEYIGMKHIFTPLYSSRCSHYPYSRFVHSPFSLLFFFFFFLLILFFLLLDSFLCYSFLLSPLFFAFSAGHGRDAQGLWDKPFFFAYLCDPLFGHHSSTDRNQGLGSGPEQVAGAGTGVVTPATATVAAAAAAAATPSTPSSSNQSTVPAPVPAPTPTSGALSSSAGVCDVDQEMETLRTAISAINKLRPRFVVVTGSFTHAYPSSASPSSSPSSSTTQSTTPSSTSSPSPPSSTPSATQVTTQAAETLRDLQLNQFMRTMARVSETIPLLFVPGDRDVGEISFLSFPVLSFTFRPPQFFSFCTLHSVFPSNFIHSLFLLLSSSLFTPHSLLGEVPTTASLAAYRKLFGRDHYGFWYGGVRCLVVNSPLLIHPEVRRSHDRLAML